MASQLSAEIHAVGTACPTVAGSTNPPVWRSPWPKLRASWDCRSPFRPRPISTAGFRRTGAARDHARAAPRNAVQLSFGGATGTATDTVASSWIDALAASPCAGFSGRRPSSARRQHALDMHRVVWAKAGKLVGSQPGQRIADGVGDVEAIGAFAADRRGRWPFRGRRHRRPACRSSRDAARAPRQVPHGPSARPCSRTGCCESLWRSARVQPLCPNSVNGDRCVCGNSFPC